MPHPRNALSAPARHLRTSLRDLFGAHSLTSHSPAPCLLFLFPSGEAGQRIPWLPGDTWYNPGNTFRQQHLRRRPFNTSTDSPYMLFAMPAQGRDNLETANDHDPATMASPLPVQPVRCQLLPSIAHNHSANPSSSTPSPPFHSHLRYLTFSEFRCICDSNSPPFLILHLPPTSLPPSPPARSSSSFTSHRLLFLQCLPPPPLPPSLPSRLPRI